METAKTAVQRYDPMSPQSGPGVYYYVNCKTLLLYVCLFVLVFSVSLKEKKQSSL